MYFSLIYLYVVLFVLELLYRNSDYVIIYGDVEIFMILRYIVLIFTLCLLISVKFYFLINFITSKPYITTHYTTITEKQRTMIDTWCRH